MKSLGTILLSVLLACPQPAQQTAPATQTAHPAQKTISSQLGLYAFPAKNQNGEQQQTDELSCYNWAKQDTAFDPLAALTAAQSAKSTSTAAGAPPSGPPPAAAAAMGAARGAALGAIAGDAGKGAAIGAAGGGLRGKIAQKRAQTEAQQHAQQQAQQQAQAKARTQSSLDDFKKAYSACMDAKGYSVR
jgi:hypothetical protein